MTSNTRAPKAEITGIYGSLLKKMSRKMLGDDSLADQPARP